ncbi:MAG: alpha/beta hydrolase [Acidobacteria bacterium]|nr:alpha/beta hydrolase [Acidobacteriota bacterium]
MPTQSASCRHFPGILVVLIVAVGLLVAPATRAAAQPLPVAGNVNIPLWPAGAVPDALGDGPLDSPFLTVFAPPPDKRNGSSVIIAPGGSNIMLMYGAEGFEAAERYNEWGAVAFVFTYRLSPRYNEDVRVRDARRAVQVVRSRAREWGLDPNRIGYAGFSAGSNTARTVAATAVPGDPQATDPVGRVSSRPDYLVLVYGPGRATPEEPLKDFPPTFLVSAAADRGPSIGNAELFVGLTRAGATAELHVFQKGRHGFGTGFGSPEFGDWMLQLKRFLTLGDFLPGEQR